jgi:sterol desaturase/sphingolipid hydroxylase (fatty acid hydroxylase superfamily)
VKTFASALTSLLAGVVALAFLAFTALETWRPLRRAISSKPRRVGRNLTMGGISLACVTLLQTPILAPFAVWSEAHGVGLLNLLPMPSRLRVAVGVLLLDYTLWIWHRWNHLVPFLWRFHLVHHVDRDMDASTALRFHFGEQTLSIGFRLLQVAVLGAGPAALWVWQGLLVVSILFHHSNARLPVSLERILVRVIVTPRMHGIHHSNFRNEANGNWSSLLSAWDYLHGTVLLSVPQAEVTIGVPAYAEEREVTIDKILAMPFLRQRDDWVGPAGPRFDRSHDFTMKARLVP